MSKANDLARLLNASGELQAADIEDGVITAAKLASTLDLSGKTVTLPSGTGGKVLQVVSTHSASDLSLSSSYQNATIVTATITPSSTSSKLYIVANALGRENAQGSAASYSVVNLRHVGQTTLFSVHNAVGYYMDVASRWNVIATYLYSPATTSAVEIDLWHNGTSSASTTYTYQNRAITIMEIAG